MATMTVPARYNGPPRSANGGYACGMLASHATGPVRVRLKAPPPLDRPMQVRVTADGLDATDGDVVVATASRLDVLPPIEVPRVVTVEEAADAVDDYLGWDSHVFPTCYVCGPDRGDGLRLFPGPVDDDVVATPWIPDRSVDAGEGIVDDVFLWAALDCPSYFGGAAPNPAVLADLAISVVAPVIVGQPHVVLGWQYGAEGRRHHAGSAILSGEGEILAVGDAHWVEVSDDVLASFL